MENVSIDMSGKGVDDSLLKMDVKETPEALIKVGLLALPMAHLGDEMKGIVAIYLYTGARLYEKVNKTQILPAYIRSIEDFLEHYDTPEKLIRVAGLIIKKVSDENPDTKEE